MRRHTKYLATAAITAVAVTGCGSSSSSSSSGTAGEKAASSGPVTLRIASNSNTSALPVWTAVEKDLCASHQIKLAFTKIENIGTLPPALGKSFDVIFTTPVQAISATSQGIPITQIAGASIETPTNSASYLFVAKGSPITDLKQLAGKRIGVLTEVGTLHYSSLYLLKKAGVPLDSIKIVQIDGPTQKDQLAAGRVDAVETVRPFNKGLEAAGGKSIGTPFSSVGETISPIWWGAGRSWTEQNAGVAKRFQACLADAGAYIKSHDADARQVLQKYTGLPAAVAQSFELPEYDSSVRPADTEKWLQAMREVVDFKGNVDISKLSIQP
jgi:NitT/TauT family transport system substrate-binding protein